FVEPYDIDPGPYVNMTVTDTGEGMDEETLGKIFEPFFTTKESDRGTGLGLASANGIIKNHGGIIIASSQKGEGTTFNIYLPATETPLLEADAGHSDELVMGQETILLIDDEEMILDVSGELIQKLGYDVMTAQSGEQAISTYEDNTDKIALVILDMIMPTMGGGEIFERLKGINPDVKVLLTSGYALDGQVSLILERGCNGFIQKPFKPTKLSQEIRQILGNA
ncbi:MAG: response regulator, partial [Desulfobacterales bacterium]